MQFQKRFLLFAGFLCLILNSKAQQSEVAMTSDSTTQTIFNQSYPSLSDSVINYGKIFLNTPYRYGSRGVSNFDCSGFTSHIYGNFGYLLQRSSSDQGKQFPTVQKTELQTGDLVFFEGRKKNGRIGHVGIVTSANKNGIFDFIHASVQQGVIISNSQEPYYSRRYVKAVRIIGNGTTARNSFYKPEMIHYENTGTCQEKPNRTTIPAVYHKVKPGENLSSIAEKYGTTVVALKQKNHLRKNLINVNQRLKIKNAVSYTKPESVLASSDKSATSIVKISDSINEIRLDAANNSLPAITTHIVKKGETLNLLANRYQVSISEIKSLNNLNNNNISIGQQLKLAKVTEKIAFENTAKNTPNHSESGEIKLTVAHKVIAGENLFTISKKYNIPVDEIKKINQLTDNKITLGQVIEITGSNILQQTTTEEAEQSKNPEKTSKSKVKTKIHKVKAGESLYTIATRNNISVDELKLMNQLTHTNIQPGQVLVVNRFDYNLKENEKISTKIHLVKHGESLYNIAKTYGCSVDEIKSLNGKTHNDLKTGEKLKVYQRK
ncbi:MAG: LysM peptidoglycan-binding domain-containing protein [Paludibacter sp.]|nr:LysM peptidoglycan-binding domain-containing protein [Paludibacter sp.]